MPRPITQKHFWLVQCPRFEFPMLSGAIVLTLVGTLTTSLFSWAIVQPASAQDTRRNSPLEINGATDGLTDCPPTTTPVDVPSNSQPDRSGWRRICLNLPRLQDPPLGKPEWMPPRPNINNYYPDSSRYPNGLPSQVQIDSGILKVQPPRINPSIMKPSLPKIVQPIVPKIDLSEWKTPLIRPVLKLDPTLPNPNSPTVTPNLLQPNSPGINRDWLNPNRPVINRDWLNPNGSGINRDWLNPNLTQPRTLINPNDFRLNRPISPLPSVDWQKWQQPIAPLPR
jgi:hypothetical protein